MPYIKEHARQELEYRTPETPGELNYLFTKIALTYVKERGERYYVYNEIVGALDCAKMELYRRHIAPYEDKSIKENGDVVV